MMANQPDPDPPEIDAMFRILANQRRRTIIRILDHEDRTTIADLAERLAMIEEGHTGSDARQRVYIALYQAHLPRMAEAGIIEYDQSSGMIEAHEEALRPYMEALPEERGVTERIKEVLGWG